MRTTPFRFRPRRSSAGPQAPASRSAAPPARAALSFALASALLTACGGEGPGGAAGTPPDAPAPVVDTGGGAGPGRGAAPGLPAGPGAGAEPGQVPGADAGSGDGWTVGTVTVPFDLTAQSQIPVVREVRTAAGDGFDRTTVELSDGEGMPGYHVEYVDRPLHQCGSGFQIHPVGEGWLQIRLEPAQAHTEAGAATLPGREMPAQGRLQRRVYLTCDFEAVVSLVVALDSPNPFRVFTLREPRRIVVDVRHSRR